MIIMEEKIPAANLKPIFFTINAPRGAATNDYNTNHRATIAIQATQQCHILVYIIHGTKARRSVSALVTKQHAQNHGRHDQWEAYMSIIHKSPSRFLCGPIHPWNHGHGTSSGFLTNPKVSAE